MCDAGVMLPEWTDSPPTPRPPDTLAVFTSMIGLVAFSSRAELLLAAYGNVFALISPFPMAVRRFVTLGLSSNATTATTAATAAAAAKSESQPVR